MNSPFLESAAGIRLLALDVDGVLTDGQLYFNEQGEELKAFNTQDGHGIKMLKMAGIEVAIITGRKTRLVEYRAKNLGVTHLFQGREDKLTALKELAQTLDISLTQIAYAGDDLPDLSAIRAVGLGIAVANAHGFVRQHADLITHACGGQGAVREICDYLLDAKGLLDGLQQGYLG